MPPQLTPFSFAVLGSGSGGNSAVIQMGESLLLIDAGLSAKQLALRLEGLGLDPQNIRAILLTHEHGDHTRGLDVFCRKFEVPVYANAMTRQSVEEAQKYEKDWKTFETGSRFKISLDSADSRELEVLSFAVPHDAAEPVGFRLEYAAVSLGLLSDVGYITNLIREYLRGVDALFVEANYDQKLLEADTRRPWSTKQRISSRHGHLCNEQSAELVSELFAQSGHPDCAVVLGHLSSDCNTAELARGAVSQSCHQLVGMRLFVAEQKLATPLIPISAHSASAELNKDNEGSEDNESTEDAVGQLEEQSQLTF